MAVIIPILRMSVITPFLNRIVSDSTYAELVHVPLLSVPYVVLPLFVVLKLNKWTTSELGLTWKVRSRSVAVFAVV